MRGDGLSYVIAEPGVDVMDRSRVDRMVEELLARDVQRPADTP